MKERLLHVRHAKAFSFYKPRAFNKAEVSGDFNPVKRVKVCIKSSVLPLLSTCLRGIKRNVTKWKMTENDYIR